jgi:1-acyl-sn-glycerol-3-phosphate acyltransferase
MLSDKVMYWASRPVVSTYTGTMLKMDVRKHTPMPTGAKIIAANHPSTTDPFFVAAMVRSQSFILINELLFEVPVLGEYLRRSGHIPVCAGRGQAAVDAAIEHLKAGHTVIIFPEGDLSPAEGGVSKARTGVARLALASGAPVIPVGIFLQRSLLRMVRSVIRGKESWGRWYLRGPYGITVGTPVCYTGDVEDRPHVRVVADSITHQIIELVRESEDRLTPAPGLSGAFESF